MNNNNPGPIINSGWCWTKQMDGTYTKSLTIYYKHGRNLHQVVEENVSENEYFKRKLDGTA